MTRPETLAGEKSLERWVLRRADHVLGNSTTVIEELRKFGVSPNKLGLIANGIDPSAFEDARSRCELRSEEHTSELQSLMRISYAVFCLKKKTKQKHTHQVKEEEHHYTSSNNTIKNYKKYK